eukprot:CAMPEP_0169191084 /NCGR_PEP_ID=MMETSP1016-20121227/4883_1 /TAXON_ID=342587 /ORGANISM="Karlodinium micrum, Strain CCMP2283" /LENGTH=387 /DNA_ID=CAMNT_0009267315 /DNA_START=22 /DNA_END=1181 /DNA_ORIENTATION=-
MIAKILFVFSWAVFNSRPVVSVGQPHRQRRQLIVHAGGHAIDAHQSASEARDPENIAGLYDVSDKQNQTRSRKEHGRGVVCPTWLQLDIQNHNLKPYIRCAGVTPEPFIAALYASCRGIGLTYATLANANYTGSWDHEVPTENDLRVLSELATWAQEQVGTHSLATVSWEQFSENLGMHGPTIAELAQSVLTHPSVVPVDEVMHILDYGCGTGNDLASLKSAFHTESLNAICLDIVPVQRNEVYSILLDGSSDFAYNRSLQAASVGLVGTMHLVISICTFHHIARPQMRHDALVFIEKVLQPGGVFLMSEWDDSLNPSRQIHYDLVHGVLPTLLFQSAAPTHLSELHGDSRYLSVNSWIDLVQSAHLTYDANRSQTWPGLLEPEAAA